MKWNQTLMSILTIILGILFVMMPNNSANVICLMLGIMLIVSGVLAIGSFVAGGKESSSLSLVSGIAFTLAGLVCITNPTIIIGIISFILGLFIVVDACTHFAESIQYARLGIKGWFIVMLISIIVMIFGGLILFGAFELIFIYAGIALIVDGIFSLIMVTAFSNKVKEAKKQLHDN